MIFYHRLRRHLSVGKQSASLTYSFTSMYAISLTLARTLQSISMYGNGSKRSISSDRWGFWLISGSRWPNKSQPFSNPKDRPKHHHYDHDNSFSLLTNHIIFSMPFSMGSLRSKGPFLLHAGVAFIHAILVLYRLILLSTLHSTILLSSHFHRDMSVCLFRVVIWQ